MRWFWIDRFIEFESGRKAAAIKNVSMAEEHLVDHLPGYPIMPSSLIVEGVAQTGGILVSEHNDFRKRVVLAKVSKAEFFDYATPGDCLRYTVEPEDIQADGAICKAQVHILDPAGASEERLLANINLMFAYLDDKRFEGVDLFRPGDLLQILRISGVFDVGRTADGKPLTPPDHLLQQQS